uniref:Putative c2h2-type zn-finger protein n=1 Tax=Culex tarsalis TaxID=7177 RepID=A0A1Q3F0N9_CULTA
MEQNLTLFELDPRCRLCRSPDATSGRTSVFENDRNQRQIVSEMISCCTAVKIYDHDRLPQHVCGRCLEQLRQTYALWKKCNAAQRSNLPQCQKGKEEEYCRCRICHVEECDELFSVDYPGRDGEVLIGEMLKDFANVTVLPGDGLAPYVCDICLDQLERARDFKRQCLQAEEAFLSDTIHAWEKMEFQEDQPSHLVVELYAKAIFETPTLVRCSVCGLKQSAQQLKKLCDGCKLDFCDQERPGSVSERNSPLEALNECETDDEVELLVVVDSDNDEEPDKDQDESLAKRPRMMERERKLIETVTSKPTAKTNHNGREDSNAVPARSISRHLAMLNQKIEDHFQIVTSPPGATHQTMRLKTFLCCGCNRFLLTDEAFRKHLREYHAKPTIRSQYVCGICNSAFGSKGLFLAHKDKLDSRLYNYCKICDLILLEERSFVRHQMKKHLTDRQLQQIENQFVRNVSLKCRAVQSVPDGDATCDDCGKSFATEEDMAGHRYESFRFSCQQKNCDYVTKNREFMIVHCVIGDHSQKEPIARRRRPRECTMSIFEEPPKVNKSTVPEEEDTFEVELEGGIDDDDLDWEPYPADSVWIRPDSVKRSVKLPFGSTTQPKTQPEDSIPLAPCRASLEKLSLTMEDMFEVLDSTPCETRQHIRRKTPFCCGCNRFLLSEEAFLKHREKYHPKVQTDSKFVCHVCRTTFESKKGLYFHSDKKNCHVYNYCKPCDRVILDEKTFVRHFTSLHLTERQMSELEQQFASVPIKKCTYHSRTSYAGLTSKRTDFRCNFCRRYFATQVQMDAHMQDAVEYSCLAEGCEIKSRHKLSMIVHCSLGDHRKAPKGELKELNFRAKSTLFDDALPVAAERVEDLSQAAIPFKRLRVFLKGNSLRMEDIFEVLQDIDNSYVHCLKLQRKKPICCACNVMFMTEQALSSHMQKEHTERPGADVDPELVCTMCFTVFRSRLLKQSHTNRLQLKNSKYVYCKLCDSVSLSPNFTRHNVMRHLTDEKLTELEAQFATLSSLGCRDADAMSEINEGSYVRACTCGKKFESVHSAKAHQASQNVVLYCKVEGCRFQTTKKVVMYEHCMQEAHDIKKSVESPDPVDDIDEEEVCFPERKVVYYKCCVAKCFKKYALEESLLLHFASEHGPVSEDPKANTCRNCKVTFSSDEELRTHMDRRLTCNMFKCINTPCKYKNRFLANVKLHYKLCKQVPPTKAWKCPKDKIPEHFAKVGQLDEMIDIIEGKGSFCCGCRRVMASEAELQEHLRQEHATRDPARPVHCPTCNKGFKLPSFLENHVRESAERRYYYCRICKTVLRNELQVKHHKTYIHAFDDPSELAEFYDTITSDLLPCCGCDAKFDTAEELATHCSLTHPVPATVNRLMCPNCHEQLSSLKAMSSHCSVYGSKTYYRCKIGDCRLQTKVLAKIQRHVSAASHESVEKDYRKYLEHQETFYCCVARCSFSTESYDLLIDHGVVEHAQEREDFSALRRDRPVTCPVCCKGFYAEKQLTNHRNGAVLVTCEVCKSKTRTPDYAAHLEECRKNYSRTCSKCPEVFSSLLTYRRHFEKFHSQAKKSKPKKVICNICGKLVTEYCLQDHIAMHENKRSWKCKQCSLAFNTKTQLSMHLRRVHTTERKFRCKVSGCDKTYRHDIDRVRHEMVVHFNHKPFACSECPETFVRNRDLQLHMRTHTGRKLFWCSRCRADFDRKSEFVAHQERCGESTHNGDGWTYEEFIIEEVV